MSGHRSLDPEGWASFEQTIGNDKILSNAFRLMRDANMLFDFGSYASTVALASVALEEIGKHLLLTWSKSDSLFSYDKRRLHLMKQCAVAALFMADSARRECKAKNIDFQALKTTEDFAELARAILTGLEREKYFANAALGKVLEIVKWSGLYYDEPYAEKGIEPSNITADHARSVMEILSKAFMVIAEPGNVKFGMYTFPYLHETPLSPVE